MTFSYYSIRTLHKFKLSIFLSILYSLTFPDDKDSKQDIRILNEIENIDDDLEKEGIVIVRIDNDAEAKEYGIDHLPALIYFEDKLPAIYEGKFLNIQIRILWCDVWLN